MIRPLGEAFKSWVTWRQTTEVVSDYGAKVSHVQANLKIRPVVMPAKYEDWKNIGGVDWVDSNLVMLTTEAVSQNDGIVYMGRQYVVLATQEAVVVGHKMCLLGLQNDK